MELPVDDLTARPREALSIRHNLKRTIQASIPWRMCRKMEQEYNQTKGKGGSSLWGYISGAPS